MAIDDNASYELTGYQVKDLAQKIRAKADSASLALVATSGLYADIIGAPTIPIVYNGTLTIQQNGTTIGTFSANQSTDTTINLTGGGATYSDFTGATSSSAGAHGLVPAPAAGDQEKVLTGDGTWKEATAKLVEMSYGESNAWTKFINAYNAGSIVYCRASSNSNPATGTQGRKAFMAYVNNATSPTEVEFQYVRSVSSKTDSQQGDQVFVYKLTNASGGTWTVATRNMSSKIVAGTGMTSSFTTGANGTITLNAEPDYSTSEVDTKVKWVDGKTIYRKTINFSNLPNNSTKNVAHGVSGLSQLVKIDAIMNRPGTNGGFYLLPFVSKAAANDQVEVSVNDTNVSIATNIDWSSCTAYVTIYYTKS